MITSNDIETKLQEVRKAYAKNDGCSPEYEKVFDELHIMNMIFMAQNYRKARGLSPDAKTPYDKEEKRYDQKN